MTVKDCTDTILDSSVESFKTLLSYHSLQVDHLVEYYYSDDNVASIRMILQLLCNCLKLNKKIILVGCGKSLKIAKKTVATLHSMGLSSISLHPTDALHGDIGCVERGDCILACSTSGETEEIIKFLKYLDESQSWIRENGEPIHKISVCGNGASTMARMSDGCLLVPQIYSESDIQNGLKAPTVSTTSMLIMLDCLCLALSQTFLDGDIAGRNKIFETMHPGGSIGKKTCSNELIDGGHDGQKPATILTSETGRIRSDMEELDLLRTLILNDWIDWKEGSLVPSRVVQNLYKTWKKKGTGSFESYLNAHL